MRLWVTGAHALMCVATAAVAGPAFAQQSPGVTVGQANAPIPRVDGYAEIERLPDFVGVWNREGRAASGGEPKLTPAAQRRLDAARAKEAVEGVAQDLQVDCVPPGMPLTMRHPYPIEFIFSPNRVTVFVETYSQARRIYTDGRALPEDPDPFFNGSSVGRWEGDVLVVETIGFNPRVEIARGIPNNNMHIRERMWLESPERLLIETTITDPEVLAEPLVQTFGYQRKRDWEIREYVCAENNRLTSGPGGANIDLRLDDPFPPAD